MERVLNLLELDPKCLYKLAHRMAMRWITAILERLDAITIRNCRCHIGLLRNVSSQVVSLSNICLQQNL